MAVHERWRLKITGIVQGVGIRPFVYSLATRHALTGFVLNNSSGVTIEIEGPQAELEAFVRELKTNPPPLALIETFAVEPVIPGGSQRFEIHLSEAVSGESTPISPDIATCDACSRELADPADRRYRYPFLNCTDCGPRFTIICDIPYDRPFTTMAGFKMCPACDREYHDPLNRRFHAQPNACPQCGPSLSFHPGGEQGEAALGKAMQALAAGKIIAVKGIGGFHLACDATNDSTLAELRRRKGRVDKPFALMARDLE
ncbi:MAG: acylphosphatase, partial [Candidatus Angelobacter sp.]